MLHTNYLGGNKMKKNNNSIKFNLVEGEVVRKVQYTKDSMMVSRIATFSFLKVLDHEGLLPKGYLTRVKNGHISYHTCVLMCRKQSQHSAYRLASAKYGEYTLIGLVEKPNPQPEPTPVCYAYGTDMECTDCNRHSAEGALCKHGYLECQHNDTSYAEELHETKVRDFPI